MKIISVIPLSENFLQRLAEEIFERHFAPNDPLFLHRVSVLIPNRRGAAYVRDYLFKLLAVKDRRPFFPPRLIAIEDFINQVAVSLEEPPRRLLTPPEQAWVLFGIVQGSSTYGRVSTGWDQFFPWGTRLAALLEEIERELVTPRDILYPEDVPREATALLEGLEEIYAAYDRRMREEGFTTKGKRLRLVAEMVEQTPSVDGSIYLAGFYALTGAEQKIFRHLFNNGAQVFWHADPDDLPPLYRRWKTAWNVEIETRGETAPLSPRLHFYESYDLHAELLHVQEVLPTVVQRPDQCALVLPDPSALVPTLYSLPPGMPVNISLGYPLERTVLFSLIEGLMRLQEGRNEEGAYYYQEYLTLIRHPFVRRLPTSSGTEGRIVLHLLEEKIRHYGRPFLSGEELIDILSISEDPERDQNFLASEGLDLDEAQGFIAALHRFLLTPWEALTTPADVARALREVLRFLFDPFMGQGDLEKNHPLDNEFLYTMEDSVIPALEGSLFSQQPMGMRLLFSLLRDLVRMARTPFEGHPLVGLQVLGLLETRLLSFDTVIVIDVNEDVVPAQEEVNPLLPEPLKGALGLAGREREEAIIRYHFERPLFSAHEAHLLWQASSMPASSGLDGKKVRSRFIEGLLWREERHKGTLMEGSVVKTPLHIPAASFLREGDLVKRGMDQQKVRQFLIAKGHREGLSASLLNTYLQCPLKFYYHYLLALRPARSVTDDVDSAALGEIVHQSLEDYFATYRMKAYIKDKSNDHDRLISIFHRRFRESTMYRCLAPEKRFFLEHAAAYRLKGYLSHMPPFTFIDALEEERRLSISLDIGEFSFYGKVDRIDERDGLQIILDYKTGKIEGFAMGHFEKRLVPFSPPQEYSREGLKALRGAIQDLQLPLYVLLVTLGTERELGRTLSAYVVLGVRGEERYFVAPERFYELRDTYIAWFSQAFPCLLTYLLSHMVEAPSFYPATDEQICRFCDYEPVCRFSFA